MDVHSALAIIQLVEHRNSVLILYDLAAVNIKGVCNVSNETKYEKEPPKDGISQENFFRKLYL
jgi:hypothetical protein